MATIPTFDDFQKLEDGEVPGFVLSCITAHKASDAYKTAQVADLYDKQQNKTVMEYARTLYTAAGVKTEDFTASNHKLCSNFFNSLNTKRCLYSLGNGVSFIDVNESGKDTTKESLGKGFDSTLTDAAYYALIHGTSFLFWDMDKLYVFKLTEFVPLLDETTGELRAGIRFWQLDERKPLTAVLYEEDGFTVYRSDKKGGLQVEKPKRAYKLTYSNVPADDMPTLIGEENYATLPIIQMFATRLKQSTLVGMQGTIDAYDLINSGFANDLSDCAEIYWIVSNAGGMDTDDLMQFRDTLKLHHIANVDGGDGAGATPYTQEPPYQARATMLTMLRSQLYEDFGALDVHTVSAGSTNDHIDMAYQAVDERAADFEKHVGDAIEKLLALLGIDDSPVFRRSKISNQPEQVQMVLQEAPFLDEETILRKLPNIRPEEAVAIMERKATETLEKMQLAFGQSGQTSEEEQEEEKPLAE